MLFGMDTGIIGGVLKLDPFRKTYNLPLASENPALSANLEANIVSTLQAGCFLGAIGAGYVADRWGRRWGMMAAAALAGVGAVMQAAAEGEFGVMYVGRFVAGVGELFFFSLFFCFQMGEGKGERQTDGNADQEEKQESEQQA